MSDLNKFTPGPWVVSKDDSEIEKFVVAARGTVCEVFESFTEDSVWGNAFLISAAPDLLEALEMAEAMLCRLEPIIDRGEDDSISVESEILFARAAISKARGQQ